MATSPTAARNTEAINADVVKQLITAPEDLKGAFRTAGYDGVARWMLQWTDLVNTVLRVYSFGLMSEQTRQQALLTSYLCTHQNIPAPEIALQARRLQEMLDPYGTFRPFR